MSAELDHITVAAATLDEGSRWVSRRLGVKLQAGGSHSRMGTHNRLLRLGPKLFLEVIAPDPAVPEPPRRPRWFALDDPGNLRRLQEEGPRLAMWVARTSAIHRAAARSPIPLGSPERVSRGTLEWLITVPADGSLPEDGAMPTLIQWPPDAPHPAQSLPDLGFSLAGLEVGHREPDRLLAAWDAVGLERALVSVARAPTGPALSARIALPGGGEAILAGA